MKNIKLFFNTIIIAGAVILFGTAGVSDNSMVEFAEVLKRVIFALALISSGVWGRCAITEANDRLKKRYKQNLNAAIKIIKA